MEQGKVQNYSPKPVVTGTFNQDKNCQHSWEKLNLLRVPDTTLQPRLPKGQ